MANYLLEALKRQKLTQMSHQPQPLPPDLLGAMSRAESKLYDRSMIYKAMKDAVTAPGRAYRGEIDALMDPIGAMEEAMNTAGMAQLGGIPGGARGPGSVGMITYHGSPHKFDKFDMSKIGTGEGAQAYGHGLYMAESPNVASKYAKDLAEKYGDVLRVGKHEISTNDWRGDALLAAKRSIEEGAPYPQYLTEKQVRYADKVRDRGLDVTYSEPNLYKVDIPDEAVARMLDWDKPLSHQAPEVQAALQKAAEIRSRQTGGAFGPLDMTQAGKDLIPTMGESRLKDAGIPGIRYLDGGSRTAGDGTSNFVLFDDQLPRILERNGEATGLQPWQPGEANALLGIPSARPRNALGQEEKIYYHGGVPYQQTYESTHNPRDLMSSLGSWWSHEKSLADNFANGGTFASRGKNTGGTVGARLNGKMLEATDDFWVKNGFVENKINTLNEFDTIESMLISPSMARLSNVPVMDWVSMPTKKRMEIAKQTLQKQGYGGLRLRDSQVDRGLPQTVVFEKDLIKPVQINALGQEAGNIYDYLSQE